MSNIVDFNAFKRKKERVAKENAQTLVHYNITPAKLKEAAGNKEFKIKADLQARAKSLSDTISRIDAIMGEMWPPNNNPKKGTDL